ncbi:crossover junction endodeoxyribonuclease RuvC [candidate division WOR-3 bacterium]|nr:crossover junction endodeoxyribonuclease RuvC [candidate division WOR-3 bacterium]
MRILGIDPGLASTGAVVIEADQELAILHKEMIRTKSGEHIASRLGTIAEEIERIIDSFRPQLLALESAFIRRDAPQTGLSLGKVLGVVILTAHRKRLKLQEVTPREVKETLTGYGNATKEQIERAVKVRFKLKEPLRPDHVADAAAIALTAASIVDRLGSR